MSKQILERFFKELGRVQKDPVDIYLTGGMASSLMGGIRPTRDIDFAFRLKGRPTAKKRSLWEENIRNCSEKTGIPIEYSEDISRWSMIDYGPYLKGADLWRQIGVCHIKVLNPMPWSVGKITRYYDSDIKDLLAVLKKKQISWQSLIRYWADCLIKSPASSAQLLFKKQVEHFIVSFGKLIWRKNFKPEEALASFEQRLQK